MGKVLFLKNGGGVSLPTLTNEATSNELLVGKELINSKGEILVGTGDLVELNFEVIAYESELLLPAIARENTIAVITDVPISSYSIAGAEPSDPKDGMVWLQSSASSLVELRVTKNNSIVIFVAGGKQYINGVWEPVTVKVFQNGAWSVFEMILYDAGDLCSEITGGYQTVATGYGLGAGAVPNTVTYGASSVIIKSQYDTSNGAGGIWITKKKIDVTPYKSLKMTGTLKAGSISGHAYAGVAGLCLLTSASASIPWNTVVAASNSAYSENGAETTLNNPTVDVSALKGEFYIGIGLYSYKNTYGQAIIGKLYLE